MKRLVMCLAFAIPAIAITGCSTTEEIDTSREMRSHGLPEQVSPQEVEVHPGDASACETTMDAYNEFAVSLNKYTTTKVDVSYWESKAQSKFRDQRAVVSDASEAAKDSELIEKLLILEKQARGQSENDFAGYPQNMYFVENICRDLGVEVERVEMERPD